MTRSTLDLVVGITMIVVGVLMAIGRLGLEGFLPYAGIVLIVLGVLVLVHVLPGSVLLGIVALVAGILLAVGFFEIPQGIREYMWILNLIVGIVLTVLGVQRLR
jgi:uncharacterized membrane protein HdeD (DUF308 family)